MRLSFAILLLAMAFFSACRPGTTENVNTRPGIDMTDFFNFYQSFHMDSAYQMDHIIFPLQGLPADADSLTIAQNNFTWEQETWRLHYPIDFETSDFTRQITPLSDDIVVELIVHRSGQAGMMRRFAKMGDDWYLIYFADMNRIKQ